MPSRKKAKGQARKAEKEKKQAEQAGAQRRASCKHFIMPENATQDDVIAAHSLLREYFDKFDAIQDEDVNDVEAKTTIAFQTYFKYLQYSDVRKQVFQELILSLGTTECVKEANEKDLATYQFVMRAWPYVNLLSVIIQVLDKFQGPLDAHQVCEFNNVTCPCEMIRFFHRRNSCDCLHEIYYKLKDATTRTIACINCSKAVDVKKTFHCKCEIAQYCSKKCALEYWPNHKEDCNFLTSVRVMQF
jgi:hypothetical protein